MSAESVRTQVNELADAGADSIDVRINSYGGDVFEGLAMAHALAASPVGVVVHIDGIAASIASVVAMAGGSVTETRMASSAQIMIHNSWTELRFIGDQNTMVEGMKQIERMTGVLQTIDKHIVNAYATKTQLPEETIRQWMEEETWFDSATSLEFGFVDSVVEQAEVAACDIPRGLFRDGHTLFCKPPVILGERRVRKASEDYATERIRSGQFNASGSWSFDAADGNRLLGADGDDWERFAKAHLAENTDSDHDTKARYSYPFAHLEGSELVIYRSALAAIRQRSSAEDDGNIYSAAGRLMDLMDEESDANARSRQVLSHRKTRLMLSQARAYIC